MTMRASIVLALSITALGCKPDPAKSVKIVAPAPAPPAPQAVLPAWQPDFCALPPEDSAGSSNFVAKGKCAFHHEGNAKCRGLTDDFHVMVPLSQMKLLPVESGPLTLLAPATVQLTPESADADAMTGEGRSANISGNHRPHDSRQFIEPR